MDFNLCGKTVLVAKNKFTRFLQQSTQEVSFTWFVFRLGPIVLPPSSWWFGFGIEPAFVEGKWDTLPEPPNHQLEGN